MSSGESAEEEKDDDDLLTMQKQRSIPPIQIGEVHEGDKEETTLLECEGSRLSLVENSPLLIGMMSAGAERQMFKKYASESPALAPPTKLGGGKRAMSPGSPTESK